MQEAIIALICLLVYWRTIYFHFTTDDLNVWTDSKHLKRPDIFKLFWEQLTGKNYYHSQSVHLIVIALHTLVSALICNLFGFFPALLFALLLFNGEVSIWVSGKGYAITTIGFLLCWKFPFLFPLALLFIPGKYISVTILTLPLLFLLKPGYELLSILIIVTALIKKAQVFNPDSPKIKCYCNHKEAWAIAPRKFIIALKFYGYYFVQGVLS